MTEKWIIPPGLTEPLEQFKSVCTYFREKRKPLIIRGPRGVGKTLFRKIAEDVFRQFEPGQPIHQRNIAATPESLVTDELFGHEKGSFTGAISSKRGVLELAGDGLIVLEEIGDISKDTQAKLLTVLEDGKFTKIGGTKELRVGHIWIIGTTNQPDESFRPDFLDRFFPFNVPPIHERRGDIMYYFHALFPELFQQLTGKEVMELLAHPWAGGVREIERIGHHIEIRMMQNERRNETSLDLLPEELKVEFEKYPQSIWDIMKEAPGNALPLLREHGLDLVESHIRPFKKAKKLKGGIIPQVEHAMKWFNVWADAFAGQKAPRNALWFQEVPPEPRVDLSGYRLKDLMRQYYEDLLRVTGGNQTEAARRAGVNPKTLHSRLKKSEISDSVSVKRDKKGTRKSRADT